ncbi:MAG TPA: LacI family transcriptional regulator, partial [Spirochaeta sp.]|nr:LacI family transcriptional regulator [Spirochaeta sp.]
TETVLLDRHFQEGLISEVTSDNYLGGCQATEYLIQMNHRNIGFVAGPRDWASAEDRFRGYRDTLGKHGITYRADLVYRGDLRFESGIGALEYYLSLTDWPSAIFCANDQMAFGVLTKANSMNISIPGDISLIGFDDIPLYSLYTTRLTAVQQNIDALCSSSFGIMMEKLRQDQDQNQLSMKRVVIPTKLKIGETCGKYGGVNHY